MSLYYDAQTILDSSNVQGSLKARIYNHKSLKCPPAQVYALVIEATKWSTVLTEIIENAKLLSVERKLNPTLALLLVHDYLLAKKGIAAPAKHPLRLAIERHKARLGAELTKARIRRQCGTIDSLRRSVEDGTTNPSNQDQVQSVSLGGDKLSSKLHPRWIRINTVRTTLGEQLATTFMGLSRVKSLLDLFVPPQDHMQSLYVDENIPNLVAVHPRADFTKSVAYNKGEIIFQDKASCFPAYLLDPMVTDTNIIDACAAPGNKTSHIVALLQEKFACKGLEKTPSRVIACERDKDRASILKRMMIKAGTQDQVAVFSGQDFLQTKYDEAPWKDATAILLDPSCSGSGIVSRDNVHKLELPSSTPVPYSKKRRKNDTSKSITATQDAESENIIDTLHLMDESETKRLVALSAFQLKLLLHAFHFPFVRKIVYSTCSIHAAENESVVCNALLSPVAKERGWKVLPRERQVEGLNRWDVRGDPEICKEIIKDNSMAAKVSDACIRCNKVDDQGTMGFFVAGFCRDMKVQVPKPVVKNLHLDDSEWEGFDDEPCEGSGS